jgi:CRP-like cAMP-binding protein
MMTGQRPSVFLNILPDDYQRITTAAARIKEFARGEMVFNEGDSVEQVILLTSGFVKITQLGANGSQVVLRFGAPGDILGAASLFSTGNHCGTAQAFRTCQGIVWSARTFKALVDSLPVLHQNMTRILGEELRELQERFREVATENVASRVARQLVRLTQKIGRRSGDEIEASLTREELAQMTGTTLFTVSRLFSIWEARGIVRPRREGVTICDVPALRAIFE